MFNRTYDCWARVFGGPWFHIAVVVRFWRIYFYEDAVRQPWWYPIMRARVFWHVLRHTNRVLERGV